MPTTPTAFNGLTVNDANYALFLAPDRTPAPFTAAPALRERVGQVPVQDSVTYGARRIPFVIARRDGAISEATFRDTIYQYFTPFAGLRTLTATHADGSTTLVLSVDVVDLVMRDANSFVGVFLAPDPVWRRSTTSNDTTSPLTVVGNCPALPTIAITPSTSTLRRRRVTVTDNSGLGLSNYMIQVSFDSTGVSASAASNYIVFYNGRSVPFYINTPNNASSKLYLRVDTPINGSCTVDVYYGSSISNTTTADQLDDGGMNLASASFSNTNWVWDSFEINAHPAKCTGVWRPVRIGRKTVYSTPRYGLISASSTQVEFQLAASTSNLANDYDGMAMVVGCKAGTTSALVGLSRDDSGGGGTDYNIVVLYRLAGSPTWVEAAVDSGPPIAAITDSEDVDNAVEIAVVIEPTSNSAVGSMVLTASGTFQLALNSSTTPTVSVAAAVTARLINSTLTNTTNGTTLTFTNVYLDDVVLTIDCLLKQISTASGPWYGALSFSDAENWFPLSVGSNAWTDPTNAAAGFTWAPRWIT